MARRMGDEQSTNTSSQGVDRDMMDMDDGSHGEAMAHPTATAPGGQESDGQGEGDGEAPETFERQVPRHRPPWPPEPESRKGITIVIQPGSEFLRIGWAADEVPHLVPHCIARLWRGGGGMDGKEEGKEEGAANIKERDREKDLADVERTLRKWSQPTQKRADRGAEGAEEEVVDARPDDTFKLVGVEGGDNGESGPQQVYYGEDAQRVTLAVRSDGSRYVYRRLVKRGRVEPHPLGLEAQFCDFQEAWEHAIGTVMGHDLKQLHENLVVLIVPANVCKTDVKFYVTLLINRMRFRGICVLQDSIGTCYAASILNMCVVDVGHQKTSVSVVEDGVCIPCTCQVAGYGGNDVGKLLLWMLKGRSGLLAPLDLQEPAHDRHFKELKERVCYFNPPQQELATRTDEIAIHRPGHPTRVHMLRVGNAACVAPLGIFYPKLAQPEDPQKAHRKPWYDPEELCDEEYVAEMLLSRPGGAGQSQTEDKLNVREEHLFPPDSSKLVGLDRMVSDAIARARAVHEANAKDEPPKPPSKDGRQEVNKAQECVQKLYSNVVIVGGCAGIKGFAEVLEARLNQIKPPSVKVNVQVNPREKDSNTMAWVGGGIIASVESFKEVFLSREEWEARGVGVLREKVMFPW